MFKKPKIFISYSRKDQVLIRLLLSVLKAHGFYCFLDEESILAEKYDDVIEREIAESNCFIACITSQSWLSEGYVKKEWNQAAQEKKSKVEDFAIIPLIIDRSVSPLVEEDGSIFKKDNIFPLYERSLGDLLILIKKSFNIPIIEPANTPLEERKYNLAVGKKSYSLQITYTLYIFERIYFEDEPGSKNVWRLNLFNYSRSVHEVAHTLLDYPLIVILSFDVFKGTVKDIQFEYQGVKIYPHYD